MRTQLVKKVAVVIAAIVMTLGFASPAAAVQTFSDFDVKGWEGRDENGSAEGTFTWNNRTTEVRGNYWPGHGRTWVIFEAFAGSTKVDSKWAEGTPCGPEVSCFWFINTTIGDPNRVGGINRIKVTVCMGPALNDWDACGQSVNYAKPTS